MQRKSYGYKLMNIPFYLVFFKSIKIRINKVLLKQKKICGFEVIVKVLRWSQLHKVRH